MTFYTPIDGDDAVAEHVAQITEALSGVRTIPITLTGGLDLIGSSSSVEMRQSAADTQPRVRLDLTSLAFGPGNDFTDASVSRAGPQSLWIDGGMKPLDTTYDLGLSANRWRKVWATDADFTGLVTHQVALGQATSVVSQSQVQSEAQPRFTLTAAGTLSWGDGNTAPYLKMGLAGADQLNTTFNDATFQFNLMAPGDTQGRAQINAFQIAFGPGGSTAPDTWLRRQAAADMRVNAVLSPEANATRDLGTTALRWAKLWATNAEFTNAPTVGGTSMDTRYSVPGHTHTGVYLPMTGGTLASIAAVPTLTLSPAAGQPALWAQGNVGVGVTPAPWRTDLNALQVQQAAFMAAGTGAYLTSNVYYDSGGTKGIVAGAGSQLLLSAQMQFYATQANAAAPGGAVTLTERLRVGNNGTVSLSPEAGVTGLLVKSDGGIVLQDNAPTHSWTLQPLVNGTYLRLTYDSTMRAQMEANGTLNLYPDAGMPGLAIGDTSTSLVRDASAGMRINTWSGLFVATGGAAGPVRMSVDGNGIVRAYPIVGQPSFVGVHSEGAATIQGPDGVNTMIHAPGGASVKISSTSTYFTPQADTNQHLGAPPGTAGGRWNTVYALVGTINTSVYSVKEDFTPLDPVACAQAVLETDWVNFAYRAPPPPDPLDPEGEEVETRDARQSAERAAYAEALVVTAPSRKQKGYVLQSPVHKTHALFGLEDRQSASPGSDLAVVACALQHALERIAALEAQP